MRAESPDHPLANQTLAVLERLEAATHVDAAPLAKKDERVDLAALADLPEKPKTIATVKLDAPPPPRSRRSGIGGATLVIACFVCLFVGIMIGAMIR